MFPALVQTLQHVIGLGPACAAACGGFDHLQTRLGFGAPRRAFLLQALEPGPISGQLIKQYRGVGRIQISCPVDSPFHLQQLAAGTRSERFSPEVNSFRKKPTSSAVIPSEARRSRSCRVQRRRYISRNSITTMAMISETGADVIASSRKSGEKPDNR